MIYHILPINDIKEHEESTTCACSPKIEMLETGDIIVVHNAYDGREYIEKLTCDTNVDLN